jgi:ABC-type multidrug transport system fused ATPase/permease subunit
LGWNFIGFRGKDLVFSSCFRGAILLPILALVSLAIFAIRLGYLNKKSVLPNDMIQQGISLFWTKIILALGALGVSLFLVVSAILSTPVWMESIIGFSSLSIFQLGSIYLHFQNHYRSRRPSSQLCSAYLVFLFILGIDLYSRFTVDSQFIGVSVLTGLYFLLFWMENMSVKATDTRPGSSLSSERAPEYFSTYLSKIFFLWVTPLVIKGKAKPLEFEDLWDLPFNLSASRNIQKFEEIWEEELERYKKDPSRSPLRASLTRRFLPRLLFLAALTNIVSLLRFSNPVMLDYLVNFMNARGTDQEQSIGSGLLVSTTFLFLQLISAIVAGQQIHYVFMQNITISQSIKPLIYTKALKMGLREDQVGEILDLISADAGAIYNSNFDLTLLSGIPLELGLAFWMLYNQVGWTFVVFVVMLVCSFPLLDKIGSYSMTYKTNQLKQKDHRVSLCNDTMGGMKTLKLYGWTEMIAEKIFASRQTELKYLRSLKIVEALSEIFGKFLPSFSTFVLFALFVVLNPNSLTPNVVFVTLSLVGILEGPIEQAIISWGELSQAYASFKRVEKFLLSEDKIPYIESCKSKENAVEIEGASFGYTNEVNVLENTNLVIEKGTLNVIVGQVASGKSSLLLGLLGEMRKTKGFVGVAGSVSYVPQKAWILDASIRENILFGEEFDEKKYKAVIEACCLTTDLATFSNGDATLVGARGVSLSGGQKARVCCARALYADADIVVMDDPLSAVDAHVDRQLFNSWFQASSGILSRKTVVLVTNAAHHLSRSEIHRIYYMEDCKIVEQGSYQDLMAQKGKLTQLIESYSQVHNVEEESPEQEVADSSSDINTAVEITEAVEKKEEKKEEGKVTWKVYFSYIQSYLESVLFLHSKLWSWIVCSLYLGSHHLHFHSKRYPLLPCNDR